MNIRTTGSKPQKNAPHESGVRFFAFASADVCFTCRYLIVYLCFLPAFGYSYLFEVWFGLDLGLGLLILIYICLCLFFDI